LRWASARTGQSLGHYDASARAPPYSGREVRMKGPRPDRMPVYGGIEKETEGSGLYVLRPQQFPLHPYGTG